MSPEQSSGEPVDGRTDLYALGCVLHEMLTGSPPFDGSTPDLILRHIREVPPAVSTLVTGTPPELDRIVGKALEKEAGLRRR